MAKFINDYKRCDIIKRWRLEKETLNRSLQICDIPTPHLAGSGGHMLFWAVFHPRLGSLPMSQHLMLFENTVESRFRGQINTLVRKLGYDLFRR